MNAPVGSTPPKKDPLHALNAHPGRMPILSEPYLAKIVTTMHTNQNPMLRNAFQCKKGSTNRVQQLKSNAQRVKQDVVATHHAKIVSLDGFKNYPATQRAVNAQLALATKPKVLRHAMVFLLVRTVGMAHFVRVIQVIFAKVRPPIKPRANPDPTPPTKDPLHALNAHPERMPARLAPLIVKTAKLIPTNRNPMLRCAFQ